MSHLAILDAPSSLGLRPPAPGIVPGCHKAPAALRAAGLLDDLETLDAGAVLPPPYDPAWVPGGGPRNAEALAAWSVQLADRLGEIGDGFRVVLGGDCSVLIGEALALRRRGRFGLAFIDGHGDFRHQGNGMLEAAAGEDLAIVTGRGDERLIRLDGHEPLVQESDVVVLGLRDADVFLSELSGLGMPAITSAEIAAEGTESAADVALEHLQRPELEGYWVHLDVDVLDAAVMPAVDSPEPDGLSFDALERLLTALLTRPAAVGLDVCIYDPDLDPGGVHGRSLARSLNRVLQAVAAQH